MSLARPPGDLESLFHSPYCFCEGKLFSEVNLWHLTSSILRCDYWHIIKAFAEFFHFSRLAAMVLTSSRDSYPAFFLSFSTVRLQLVFGLSLLLFPSGAQFIAVLQSLFWSCISPIMSHLLIYVVSPFYSEVSYPLFLEALQY